jgi:protein SCO1
MRIALVCAVLITIGGCARREPLPVYGRVPPFELVSQAGQQFDSKALSGSIWVADFIFTTCMGPCPRMSSLMKRVQDSTSGNVKLVSFTVDPQHDTPPVLAEYARRYRAEPARWYFLTGDPASLNSLAHDSFKLSSVDGSMTHSTRFVLVDRGGRIRGYYSTEENDPVPRLVADVKRLAEDRS